MATSEILSKGVKISERRDTQGAKNNKEKRDTEAIEQVLTDIREKLEYIDKAKPNPNLLIAFNEMIKNKDDDDFFPTTYNPDLFPEFEILTHFYQSDEAKEAILNAFVDFFKNIKEAKAKKSDIVIRYENYLEALELLNHAFYFSEYSTGEPYIHDPFGRNCDPYPEYESFTRAATEYLAPFKEEKDRYDFLNNTQKIRDKFSNTLILKARMYQIVGVDKNKKATLANKIYKYFYPNDKDV
ncbi:hypothetical protein [uncultured Campylobacter sp.]|uniref:hypothetical protein n=1 Tax=uncultured Campylobacter sp. TaxID=218934 RepID=UPI00261C1180|nr:hypothetical protein [uncultured Campylobacter sp.]